MLQKYTDLEYLSRRTKSDPLLMTEMISLYLEQTPPLINTMKESWQKKDWKTLGAAVHKIIPSFSIMGISSDFEKMAISVKDFAGALEETEQISDMILQLENVCMQACAELTETLFTIKNNRA